MSLSESAEPVRIACIGDSVTEGTGLSDPMADSYPVQLAAFLRAHGYPSADVRNFGQGGAGVLKRGCNPFWDTDQYGDALAFDPDVLVVLLGTNDSRKEFWGNDPAASLHVRERILASLADEEENDAPVHGELEFEQDLEELVEIFARMPAEPQIFLCTPVPVFHGNGWLDQEILRTEIAPRIRCVAARSRLRAVELLDSSLAQRPDLFPDGVHPSAAGAGEVAALVGQVLLEEGGEQEGEQEPSPSAGKAREQLSDQIRSDYDAAQAARGDGEVAAAERDQSAVKPDDQQRMEEDRQILMRELQRMSKAQALL
mmetsp:Transcript_18767/g.53019  ORF Transcript_18767/g.53019 Transcript_18767/m.53019 type:complete len:314 (-) Transcript_18767:207-1148(-)